MSQRINIFLLCCIALFCACSKGDSPQEEDGYKYEAVFIGDSITANWVREDRGHPDFFNGHNFLCMGYSGKTTDYLKRLFKLSVIDKHPRQVVISGGTNDIAQNDGNYVSNEEICDNIASMAAEAEEKGYAYADYHSALADADGGMPSAYSSDGTHPNKEGYTIMEDVILPILQNAE